MTEAERRGGFISAEHAIVLASARLIMMMPLELLSGRQPDREQTGIIEHCTIYLVCRRPAASFDPTTFSYAGGQLSGHVNLKPSGEKLSVPFQVPFEPIHGPMIPRLSGYPHQQIEIFSASDGALVRQIPASMLAAALRIDDVRQLEVLYVAQCRADDRPPLERLENHDTLQAVLADALIQMPDDEIVLLGCEYPSYSVVIEMDRIVRGERDEREFSSLFENPISDQQRTCLAEAGLIRHFTPKYNSIYRDRFSPTSRSLLNECSRFDFSSLIIEIDTGDLDLCLFSNGVLPREFHIAKFNLHDPHQRRVFFAF